MSEKLRDVNEILNGENEEKEEIINEDITLKKATFKIDKPQVEQFFDRKKVLGVLLILILLSVVFIFLSKPQKREVKEIGDNKLATKNSIEIVEEVAKKNEENDKNQVIENSNEISTENNVEDTQKTLDEYDKELGEQYNTNDIIIVDDEENKSTFSEEEKLKYKKSKISFKGIENNENSNIQNEKMENANIIQEKAQVIDTTQNRQKSKQNFISSKRNKNFYSTEIVTRPISKYEIKAGTMISAILLTSINSDLPGEMLAQVTNDVYDYRTMSKVLIPKGSKVIGRYDSNITYGQNRVLVVWDRIIFPNGNSLGLDNYQGVDLLGNSGLSGKVNNHFWKLLRSVILSAGINIASGTLEDINVNIDATSKSRINIDSGSKDLAKNVETIGSRMIEKDLNQQPTIKIKRGSRFNIFVNSDMILPRYKD